MLDLEAVLALRAVATGGSVAVAAQSVQMLELERAND